MATAKKKRNRDSGSNDSVIASRILQDIINNSSDTFRRFLQQQGVGVEAMAAPPQNPVTGEENPNSRNVTNGRGAQDWGMPMPTIAPPNLGVPMPNPTQSWGPEYEDGTRDYPRVIPGDWNRPRLPLPQSMSILDLLGIR